MNAIATTPAAKSPVSKSTVMAWLLKREFWENRGGFLWAPVITGGIVSLLALIACVLSVIDIFPNRENSGWFSGDVGQADHGPAFGTVGDHLLLAGIALSFIVLAFVVFFYALGTLHDDRRDRSLLFWKSLPVSDTQMVLSKVIWALLLAPIIAIGIGVLVGVVLWIIGAGSLSVIGLPGGWMMFTHSHPLKIIGNVLSIVPLYVLWALPAVGWLMFCSAWARSKPFLWAVLIPVLSCVIISMLGILRINLPYATIWYTVAYRGLLSILPGSWLPAHLPPGSEVGESSKLLENITLGKLWHVFGTADLWIGVVVGLCLIGTAIYLRRWRDNE